MNSGAVSSFVKNVHYGDGVTYVIGHRHADADSVFSAMAMARLLTLAGIDARARIASETDRETKAVMDYLHLTPPDMLTDASGLQLALVDHNSLSQAVKGADKACIVGIYDHHALSEIASVDIIPVFIMPVGSTGTIIYSLYHQLGAEIDAETAGILAAAIMSDTNNCRYQGSTELDKYALNELLEIAGLDRTAFNRVRLHGRIDYSGMTDHQILKNDYRRYSVAGRAVGIGYARSVGPENHMDMLARMQEAMNAYYPTSKCDLLYIMIHDYETDRQDILCAGEGAFDAAVRAIGSADGKHITLSPSISRKADFIPALTKVLTEQEESSGIQV